MSEFGIPAVGDIRNCIVALADAEPLMTELLQYRFPEADGDRPAQDRPSLAGHAVGNLLIAAITAVKGGDFEEGVRQMNRVLAVRGQVVPVSPTPVILHARLDATADDRGPVADRPARRASSASGWRPTTSSSPRTPSTRSPEADVIVLGPGSLFTSILPSLLMPGIRDAVAGVDRRADLRLQRRDAGRRDGGLRPGRPPRGAWPRTPRPGLVDVVLANNHVVSEGTDGSHSDPVKLRWPPAGPAAPRLVLDDVIDSGHPHHHDPVRLAAAVLRVVEREGSARRRAGVARSA